MRRHWRHPSVEGATPQDAKYWRRRRERLEPIITEGLVHYWDFEDGAGSSRDLGSTPIPAAPGAAAGYSSIAQTSSYSGDMALAANGAFVVPDDASYKFSITEDFSVAFWAYIDALPSVWSCMAQAGTDGGDRWAVFLTPTNVLHFVGEGGSFNAATVVPVGEWFHVVCRQDVAEPRRKIFLNSVEDGSNPNVRSSDGAGDLFIGGRRADGVEGFDGYLDHFRVYDRVLAQLEINTLYQQGK